jgi:hypothetical protein
MCTALHASYQELAKVHCSQDWFGADSVLQRSRVRMYSNVRLTFLFMLTLDLWRTVADLK